MKKEKTSLAEWYHEYKENFATALQQQNFHFEGEDLQEFIYCYSEKKTAIALIWKPEMENDPLAVAVRNSMFHWTVWATKEEFPELLKANNLHKTKNVIITENWLDFFTALDKYEAKENRFFTRGKLPSALDLAGYYRAVVNTKLEALQQNGEAVPPTSMLGDKVNGMLAQMRIDRINKQIEQDNKELFDIAEQRHKDLFQNMIDNATLDNALYGAKQDGNKRKIAKLKKEKNKLNRDYKEVEKGHIEQLDELSNEK